MCHVACRCEAGRTRFAVVFELRTSAWPTIGGGVYSLLSGDRYGRVGVRGWARIVMVALPLRLLRLFSLLAFVDMRIYTYVFEYAGSQARTWPPRDPALCYAGPVTADATVACA